MMAVPSRETIIATLRIPEVTAAPHRVHVRTDIITPAQKAVKDKLKAQLNDHIQKHLMAKAIRKRGKWDV
jgi:hypothetical protein